METIFKKLRILDLTKVLSGPLATRMFADYGAEVIKIESLEHYDDARDFPPLVNNWSGYFEVLNRNKKSINLKLSDPIDLQRFYRLVQDADVVVENMTPKSKHKLKVDYDTLRLINPALIYASLSGLGQDNDRKYYDMIAQAESGLMSLNGFAEAPLKIGPPIVDTFSGMTLAFAISSALYYREKTGKGQYIDVSMLGCAMNLLESNLIEYSTSQKNPERTGNQDNQVAPFGVYKTKDSSIALAIGNNNMWLKLANFMTQSIPFDQEKFHTNQLRLMHADELTILIDKVFSQWTTADLEKQLMILGIPGTSVKSIADVYNDPAHYTSKRLIKYDRPGFGECVVPGFSINFSATPNAELHLAPEITQTDK